MATRRPRASTRRRSSATPSSTASTAASRPTGRDCATSPTSWCSIRLRSSSSTSRARGAASSAHGRHHRRGVGTHARDRRDPPVHRAALLARGVLQVHRAHRRPDPLRGARVDGGGPGPPLLRHLTMRRWLPPEHIEDVLPAEARAIERLRRSILDLFEVHGYELVVPPLLEYLDSLLSGTGRDLDL